MNRLQPVSIEGFPLAVHQQIKVFHALFSIVWPERTWLIMYVRPPRWVDGGPSRGLVLLTNELTDLDENLLLDAVAGCLPQASVIIGTAFVPEPIFPAVQA
jgi:hypothetical protein